MRQERRQKKNIQTLPLYETREEAEKEYPDVDIFELPLTDEEVAILNAVNFKRKGNA